MSLFFPAFVLLLFPGIASAQEIPAQELQFATQPYSPAASLRVEKNLVQVDVVVRDANGVPVTQLTQQSFKVYDKGKEQAVSQFSVERAAPRVVSRQNSSPTHRSESLPSQETPVPAQKRYIALFFDDRNTPFSDLRYAQDAAKKFARENLHQGDEVGVFTASASTSLDFTTDTQKLLQAIESVRLQTLGPPPSLPPPCVQYPVGPYAAYLIIDEGDTETRKLYLCGSTSPSDEAELEVRARIILSSADVIAKSTLDALDSVVAHLAKMSGARILVLTSSGFFTQTVPAQIDDLTSYALAENIVINSLDAKGLVARAPGGGAKETPLYSRPASEFEKLLLKRQREEMDDVMASLARDTGGILFHNNNDLDLGLREMAEVPAVSYRLGFSPTNLKPDGKFHDLKVKLTIPGSFEIQARRGYFAPTEAVAKAEGEVSAFNSEVLKTDEIAVLPAQVGAQAGRLAAGGTGFQISLRVDPKSLSFQKDHGKHLDKLNLITALFTTDGKFVTGEIGVVDMSLSNNSLDALNQRGLNATVVLQATEGNYRLRVVMEDAASGKLFATSRPESIP